MPKKDQLWKKLFAARIPRNFTIADLDVLMSKCDCDKFYGGRGSAIAYVHRKTGRVLMFDGPHPGNELYVYRVKKVREFLQSLDEEQEGSYV